MSNSRQERVKEFISRYLKPSTVVSKETEDEVYLAETGVKHKDLVLELLKTNYITGMNSGAVIVNYNGFRFVIYGDK